jgi:hypothetical protein
MKKLLLALGLSAMTTASFAVPITVSGNFVQLKISDDGTVGDGNTKPALVYDPTGSGNFDSNTDYVAPGVPFEAFGFRSTETGLLSNSNSSGGGSVSTADDFASTGLTDLSGTGFDSWIRWTGDHKSGALSIRHDYFFNDSDERVNITTRIEALEDLTSVLFSRAVDPDPDNYSGGSASTTNQRGLDKNNDGDFDDADDVRPEDFVTSVGNISGRPLGLFSRDAIAHDTGIDSTCCSEIDPLSYIAGGDLPGGSNADDGLGMSFDIGSLAKGAFVELNYAYVMGLSLETVDIPDDDDDSVKVPEPSTAALFGLVLAALGLRGRKKA